MKLSKLITIIASVAIIVPASWTLTSTGFLQNMELGKKIAYAAELVSNAAARLNLGDLSIFDGLSIDKVGSGGLFGLNFDTSTPTPNGNIGQANPNQQAYTATRAAPGNAYAFGINDAPTFTGLTIRSMTDAGFVTNDANGNLRGGYKLSKEDLASSIADSLFTKVEGTNGLKGSIENGVLKLNFDGTLDTAHGGLGLTKMGLPGQVLVVNADATGFEYKTLAPGTSPVTGGGSYASGPSGTVISAIIDGTVLNQTARWDGVNWVGDSSLLNDGTNISVANNLTVGGTMTINGITFANTDVGNWNTAFGWGNHATQGYLTLATLPVETDPVFTAALDTDNTLASDSDAKVASQKAVKGYVDTGLATKQGTLVLGDATTTTAGVTLTNNIGSVIGAGLTIDIATADALNKGLLSAADWTTFNSKENALVAGVAGQYYRGDKTWATLDTSVVPENGALYFTDARAIGAILSTFVGGNNTAIVNTDTVVQALDKAQGQIDALAAVSHSAASLTTDSVGGVAFNAGTQTLTINAATAGNDGYLLATDWNTFNNKENALVAGVAGQYYRGDKTWATLDTSVVPENGALYFTDARAIGALLATYATGANSTILNTDTVVQALGKAQGQIDALNAVSHVAATVNAAGIANGLSEIGGQVLTLATAGAAQNGALSSADWTRFDALDTALAGGLNTQYLRGDKTWATLDTSVVPENGALYFTDARAIGAILSTFVGGNNTAIVNTDTVVQALDKAQGQIDNLVATKQNNLVFGDATTTTAGINLTGNIGSVIGGGLTIDIQDATTAQNGLLTAADWNTFNSKQDTIAAGSPSIVITGGNTIDTVQDIQTTATPEFTGIKLGANTYNNLVGTSLLLVGGTLNVDYDPANLGLNAGRLTTVQPINVTDTPAFAGMTLLGNLDMSNNNISNVNGLTLNSITIGADSLGDLTGTGLVNNAGTLDVTLAPFTTTNLNEGANLYYTDGRVIAAPLTGFSAAAGVTAADTVISAIQTLANNGGHNPATVDAAGIANGLSITVPQVMTIATAGAAQNGALTSADWTTFNNKQNALVIGDATTTTAGVNLTGNIGSVIGGGLTIDIVTADAVNKGLLSAADWNTFNNKEDAIVAGTALQYYRGDKTMQTLDTSVVPENGNLYYTEGRVSANVDVAANTAARHAAATIGTANGLSLAGQVLSLANADTATTGALTAADWNTFNNKQGALVFGSVSSPNGAITVTNGANSTVGPNVTIDVQDATTATNGLLTSIDWNTFNSKENAIVAGTALQYYRGDKTFATLDSSIVPENTNLYYTDARVSANVDVAANTAARHAAITIGTANGLSLVGQDVSLAVANGLTAGALSSADWTRFDALDTALAGGLNTQYLRGDKTWATLDTLVVPENGNVYWTQARFDTALAGKSTTDLVEGANLYYTDARVDANIAAKTTDNLAEGLTNLYYTDARFDTRLATKSTTDVAEGANLYWTTARFDTQLATKTSDDLVEGLTNKYLTPANFAASIAGITTDDIAEGALNKYYATALFNTDLATKSTTDLAEGVNLYFTDARVSANADVAANTAARHNAVTIGTANGLSIDPAQALSLATASAGTTGALTSADWTTFSNKQNALTIGDVTTTTAGLNLTGGTSSVIGGGLTINVQNATVAQNGLLTAADWNTFNSKQNALTAGTGVTLAGATISIGQNVASTATPTFASLTLNGNLTTSGTLDGIDLSTKATAWDAHSAATSNVHGLTFTTEGTGGGLDSDTVDGKHASDFLSATGGTLTGALTDSISDASSNVMTGLTISRSDSDGAGATGLGTGIKFDIENDASTQQTAGEINTTWTNLAGIGSKQSAITLKTWQAGWYQDALKIDGGALTALGTYSTAVGVTNRDLYVDNTGKIGYVSSSIRYKNDVAAMEDISWLYGLRPVNYTYKNDSTGLKQYGLIAEEVAAINPLFVSYNADGSVETVNYGSFMPVLIKAAQDQKASIDGLIKTTDEAGLKLNDVQTQLADVITKVDAQQVEINGIKDSLTNLGAQVANATATAEAAASAPVAPIVTSGDPTELQNAINSLNADLSQTKLDVVALQNALNNNSIIGDKTFAGAISFAGNVSFNADTVGKAEVLATTNKVEVKFGKAYAKAPIVTVTPTDFITGQYRVTDVTTNGFTIETSEAQAVKAGFNWTAFGSN